MGMHYSSELAPSPPSPANWLLTGPFPLSALLFSLTACWYQQWQHQHGGEWQSGRKGVPKGRKMGRRQKWRFREPGTEELNAWWAGWWGGKGQGWVDMMKWCELGEKVTWGWWRSGGVDYEWWGNEIALLFNHPSGSMKWPYGRCQKSAQVYLVHVQWMSRWTEWEILTTMFALKIEMLDMLW